MMKPDDIPQDVWDAAMIVAVEMEIHAAIGTRTTAKADLISRAIMAERERIEKLLSDPAAVRVNYLRGEIACQPLIDEAVANEREACAEEMDRRWRENANTFETRAAYSNAAVAIREGRAFSERKFK